MSDLEGVGSSSDTTATGGFGSGLPASLAHIDGPANRDTRPAEYPLIGKWSEEADKRANDAYYLKVVKQGVKQETADVKLPPFPKLPEPEAPEVLDVYGHITNTFTEALELCLAKQTCYGSRNISQAPGGALNGLRVRMHDKQMRINNLIDNDVQNKFESLRDSFMDLACYALIACMVLDNTWPTD